MNMFRKFRRDETGSMTVEFVIIAPLLIALIVAGFEFFDAYKSYSRAAKVTYTLADNLSRREQINEAEVLELHALMGALVPWMNGDKTLTVSSITNDADDGYVVDWSKHANKNMALDLNFELNGAMLATTEYQKLLPTIAVGDSIIFVETTIPHRTLFSMFGLTDLLWQNQIAIRPRFVSQLADSTITVGDGNGDQSGDNLGG